MRNNKFFVSLMLLLALFAAAFVMTGCGGSSNNIGGRVGYMSMMTFSP